METEEIIEQFNDLLKEYPRDYTHAYELDPDNDELYDIYTLLCDTLIDAKLSILWTQKAIGLLARSVYIDHGANPVVKTMRAKCAGKDPTSTLKPWEQDKEAS